MRTAHDTETLLEAINELALDVARLCPDCADKATRLVSLVGQLRAEPLDRGTIQDALDTETVDTDLSDSQVRRAAEAVARVSRDGNR